jgi:heat shock protein beta
VCSDAEVVKREEEAIKLDGLNVAQIKELREKSEKFTFQAEVNRMMKLIINSLYRNKEVLIIAFLVVLCHSRNVFVYSDFPS